MLSSGHLSKRSVLIVLDIALMAQFYQAMQDGIRNSTKS